jgi:hypothetical protein
MTASLTRTLRQAGSVLAGATSGSAPSSTSVFAFTAKAQQRCTGDEFVRLRNSQYSEDYRVHDQAPCRSSTGCRIMMDKDLARKPSTVAAQ